MWRFLDLTWPQWRLHLNRILYPGGSSDELAKLMRNQDDPFPTLLRYLRLILKEP